MNRLLFNDTVTHDTIVKKVFLPPSACCPAAAFLFSLLYIYIVYKCHKCQRPLFAGLSLMTLHFAVVSCVTDFVLLPTCRAGGVS